MAEKFLNHSKWVFSKMLKSYKKGLKSCKTGENVLKVTHNDENGRNVL